MPIVPKTFCTEEGRECTRCHVFYPWDHYKKTKTGYLGRTSICRACNTAHGRTYRAANPLTKQQKARNNARSNAWHWSNRPEVLRRNAERLLRKQYGLSMEDKRALLFSQKNTCPGCEKPLTLEAAVVDHSHVTKKVRGLLHRSCNAAIGVLGDSAESLMIAVKYLQEKK